MARGPKPWEIISAEFIASATAPEQYPRRPLPQAAFAGRSNCGKSSLLNCVVRRKNLARTSGTPGHTQTVNFFEINDRWHYVDLPGYGFAKAPRDAQKQWRTMIESYLLDNRRLRVLVFLLDARRKPSDLDDQLVEFAVGAGAPLLPVLTKCDKLKKSALIKAGRDIARHYGLEEDEPLIATSAVSGAGRDTLLGRLYDILTAPAAENEAPLP